MHENQKLRMKFRYLIEHIRNGVVLSKEEVDNLVPTEGLNYVVGAALVAQTPSPSWYIGLFEGDYAPTVGAVGTTIASVSIECVAYDSATRPIWTPGGVASGIADNSASKAEFTFSADKNVYGGFLISSPTKGGNTGVLASLVRFPSMKPMTDNDILRVTAGVILANI